MLDHGLIHSRRALLLNQLWRKDFSFVYREDLGKPSWIVSCYLIYIVAVIAAPWCVYEQCPAAIFRQYRAHVVPRAGLGHAPFGKHDPYWVSAYEAVVVIRAYHLPYRAIYKLDFHLVLVLRFPYFLGKRLIDDAPTLAVNAIPDDLSALSGFWQHVPVHAHALHGCSCSPVDRYRVLARPSVPHGRSALPAKLKITP